MQSYVTTEIEACWFGGYLLVSLMRQGHNAVDAREECICTQSNASSDSPV